MKRALEAEPKTRVEGWGARRGSGVAAPEADAAHPPANVALQ